MKILIAVVALFFTTGHFFVLHADEILLHEGKSIKGVIIKEDEHELMIRLANNMFLSVEKKKIKNIVRASKGPDRPVVTMQSISTSAASSTKPVAVDINVPKVSSTKPKNIEPFSARTEKNKDGVSILEILRAQVYPVTGKTFKEVQFAILSRDEGKGFLRKGHRQPSETTLDMTWNAQPRKEANRTKWVGLVILSTITVTSPRWDYPENIDEASQKDWDAFIADMENHDRQHVEIYRTALKGLSQSLANLEASDEAALRSLSQTLIADWYARTEKQSEGHDRRQREKTRDEKKGS